MQGEFKFAAASIMLQNWIVYMLAADVVQTDGGGYLLSPDICGPEQS